MSTPPTYDALQPVVLIRDLPPEDRALLHVDANNPRSIYSLSPPRLRELIDQVRVDQLELDDTLLVERAFHGMPGPDERATRLRTAFWEEYDRVHATNDEKLDMARIMRGTMSQLFFYTKWVNFGPRLAWLLHPPIEYEIEITDLHGLSRNRLRRILERDPEAKDGKYNVKLAELQFKVFESLDKRLKGAVPQTIKQTIDQRTLSISTTTTPNARQSAAITAAAGLTMDEINQRLHELRSRSEKALSPGTVKVDLLTPKKPSQEAELVETERRRERDGFPPRGGSGE